MSNKKSHSKGENIVVSGYWTEFVHTNVGTHGSIGLFTMAEQSRILGVRKTMKGAKALAYRKRYRNKTEKYKSFSYLHFK